MQLPDPPLYGNLAACFSEDCRAKVYKEISKMDTFRGSTGRYSKDQSRETGTEQTKKHGRLKKTTLKDFHKYFAQGKSDGIPSEKGCQRVGV